MGNALPSMGHGSVKLMKLDGQVMKIKAPITVDEVLEDYPDHVVLHAEAVRHLGVRAKPLDGSLHLNPKHLYFVVELPKLPRRVRSGINMNAKSRLENLVLARRSVSDISIISSSKRNDGIPSSEEGEDNGALRLRLKLRLTKTQLAKMMSESQDRVETAEKLLNSCLKFAESLEKENEEEEDGRKRGNTRPWSPALGSIPESCKSTKVI